MTALEKQPTRIKEEQSERDNLRNQDCNRIKERTVLVETTDGKGEVLPTFDPNLMLRPIR